MMAAEGSMAEGMRAHLPEEVIAELDKSREHAALLLEKFAHKLGSNPMVRNAASGVQRAAQYVQAHTVDDMAAGAKRAIRKRPGAAIAAAVLVGFLVGRALRGR
jgi:hypothetical protein